MSKNRVIAFKNPEDISEDPLTELLRNVPGMVDVKKDVAFDIVANIYARYSSKTQSFRYIF